MQGEHTVTVHQNTPGHATIWRDTSRKLSTVKAGHLGENVRSDEIKDTSGGTPTVRAYLRDTDTYVCGHWMREHTSRTRTLSEDT